MHGDCRHRSGIVAPRRGEARDIETAEKARPAAFASAGSKTRITAACGTPEALTGRQGLRKRLDAPKALSDFGFTADGAAEAAAVVQPTVPASNPRLVTTENLTRSSGQHWAAL